jgi:hypothetical protein
MRTKTNPALFVLIYFDIKSVFLKSVIEKGKGFWKIKNSISNDKYYRDMIKT